MTRVENIRLGENLVWNIKDTPHLLIGGNVNTTKINYFGWLLNQLMSAGEGVFLSSLEICYWKYVSGEDDLLIVKRGSNTEEILNGLEEVKRIVNERLYKLEKMENEKPYILFIGNLNELRLNCFSDYRMSEKFDQLLSSIMFNAAKVNVSVVVDSIRPDAFLFPVGIRDLFEIRINVSYMAEIGFSILFNQCEKDFALRKDSEGFVWSSKSNKVDEFKLPVEIL